MHSGCSGLAIGSLCNNVTLSEERQGHPLGPSERLQELVCASPVTAVRVEMKRACG